MHIYEPVHYLNPPKLLYWKLVPGTTANPFLQGFPRQVFIRFYKNITKD